LRARLPGENRHGEHCCLFSQEMGTRRRGGAEIKIQHRDTKGTEEDFARIRAQIFSPCPLCLCGSHSLLRGSARTFSRQIRTPKSNKPTGAKIPIGFKRVQHIPTFSPDSRASGRGKVEAITTRVIEKSKCSIPANAWASIPRAGICGEGAARQHYFFLTESRTKSS
jgi:hypothetical protein